MLVCSFKKSRKLQAIFMFRQRKGHAILIESSAKINVNHYQIENLETPIKQYTNDKCKENVLKET